MVNVFVLLTALLFLFSFMVFYRVLIMRYNAKKRLIGEGISAEHGLDVDEIKKLNPSYARKYSITVKLWVVSVLLFLLFAVTAYMVR